MGVPYKLYKGDFFAEVEKIPDGSIHLVLTDLPYGTTAGAWDVVIPFAPMWEQVKRVLSSNGAFITTASQPFTSALIMSNPSWFKYEWIWDKRLAGNAMNSNYQPLKIHENILVFSKNGHTYNPQMRRGRLRTKLTNTTWKSTFGTQQSVATKNDVYKPTSILDFSIPRVGREHPTQKPVELYQYLVRTYSNLGETIFDFCMGSGTTGIAAISEGREFIGIEKEAAYFSIAEKLIKQSARKPALFHEAQQSVHLTASGAGGRVQNSLQSSFIADDPSAKIGGR